MTQFSSCPACSAGAERLVCVGPGEAGVLSEAGHRGDGSGGDQIRRFSVFLDARGDGSLAVLSGAGRQIRSTRAAQTPGESHSCCVV